MVAWNYVIIVEDVNEYLFHHNGTSIMATFSFLFSICVGL